MHFLRLKGTFFGRIWTFYSSTLKLRWFMNLLIDYIRQRIWVQRSKQYIIIFWLSFLIISSDPFLRHVGVWKTQKSLFRFLQFDIEVKAWLILRLILIYAFITFFLQCFFVLELLLHQSCLLKLWRIAIRLIKLTHIFRILRVHRWCTLNIILCRVKNLCNISTLISHCLLCNCIAGRDKRWVFKSILD